jgi:hypothetical protein
VGVVGNAVGLAGVGDGSTGVGAGGGLRPQAIISASAIQTRGPAG